MSWSMPTRSGADFLRQCDDGSDRCLRAFGRAVPCSAAITVLVLCLQVSRIWLGIALVLCFSIGLAITLIAAGVITAIGMRHVSRRWSGFGELAQRLPYLSSIVMIGLGLYIGWQGWVSVPAAV